MDISELLAALTAFATDDQKTKELATAIRNKVPAVGQLIVNHGVGVGKAELQREVTRLTGELTAANEAKDNAETALNDQKAKTPDVAAAVQAEAAKWQAKLAAEKDKLTAQIATTKKTAQDAARARFESALVERGVDPDYAKETLGAKYLAKLVANDDGTTKVLQLDSDLPIDADTTEKAIAALADAALKTVAPKFMEINVDNGAGTHSSTHVGNGSYDPAKVGADLGKKQKAENSGGASLAFR